MRGPGDEAFGARRTVPESAQLVPALPTRDSRLPHNSSNGWLAFGLMVRALEAADRAARDAGTRTIRRAGALDMALGFGAVAAEVGGQTAGALARIFRPVTSLVLRPPLLDQRLHPETILRGFAVRGRVERARAAEDATALLRTLVPAIVEATLEELDLTQMVVKHVDIEAVIDRIDLDAIVARVDLDRVAAGIDVNAVAQRVDIDAIVGRIDVIEIANTVIEGIDLPEIIRESTGSMASETVRGVRLQSIEADQTVSRVVDRVLRRRRDRE